jgi:predicted patatin/cPLA2 family phospholipase
MERQAVLKLLCVALSLMCLCGCATIRPRHAVPADLLERVTISGMTNIRAIDGRPSNYLMSDFAKLLDEDSKKASFWPLNNNSHTYSVLAISGGAANGAYGVGLLNGWTKEGSRPEFKIVTGVSTGAIIGTFAFLGSQYDQKLKDFYTRYSTRAIMRRKGLLQIFFSDSYMSNKGLKYLIEHNFDQELINEVAREYAKGRRLYVGTTNLDAQEFVIWDMGKIASIGGQRALDLFRKIILASVTMPIVFPPVYFEALYHGVTYDEMHVDGGASKQIFLLYNVLQGFEKAIKKKGIDFSKIKYKIYIIRNGYVDPVWMQVPDNIFTIAERTFETATNAQGIGDLYQLYTFAQLGRGDFNLAYIPSTHVPVSKELFDLDEMRALFHLGYQGALKGYHWKKVPPGLNEGTQ